MLSLMPKDAIVWGTVFFERCPRYLYDNPPTVISIIKLIPSIMFFFWLCITKPSILAANANSRYWSDTMEMLIEVWWKYFYLFYTFACSSTLTNFIPKIMNYILGVNISYLIRITHTYVALIAQSSLFYTRTSPNMNSQ